MCVRVTNSAFVVSIPSPSLMSAPSTCPPRRVDVSAFRRHNGRMKRRATHPGEILLHEFLIPHGMEPDDLASIIGDTTKAEKLLSGQAPVTPDIAATLAQRFSTTPEFWLNLQRRHDETNF
ncbi:MAG: addiction module antidote protein, HigA family [Hyphomicrobium sp.]|nr:MAG: addiction module antidote protein, HigA family [Hyphomicrobium sp.]